MATVIFAVGVVIAFCTALMTVCDDIIRNTLAHTLIKDKVLAFKLHRQTLLFCTTSILNGPTFDVIHILKTIMQHVALAFSQRIPPVQYITIFLSLSSLSISTAIGNWSRK